jgi:hypothetical protein|eukprot:COSAG02_NODE_84_length_39615_cov_144.775256_23_plen_56_part_00
MRRWQVAHLEKISSRLQEVDDPRYGLHCTEQGSMPYIDTQIDRHTDFGIDVNANR